MKLYYTCPRPPKIQFQLTMAWPLDEFQSPHNFHDVMALAMVQRDPLGHGESAPKWLALIGPKGHCKTYLLLV